jgi:hypothetical protein
MYDSRIKVFDEGYGGKGLARGSIEVLACALQGLGSPPSSTRRVRDELFNCRAQRVFLLCETAVTKATLMIAVSSSTCGCFQGPFVVRVGCPPLSCRKLLEERRGVYDFS